MHRNRSYRRAVTQLLEQYDLGFQTVGESMFTLAAETHVDAHMLRHIHLVTKVHIPQHSWFNVSRVTTSDL